MEGNAEESVLLLKSAPIVCPAPSECCRGWFYCWRGWEGAVSFSPSPFHRSLGCPFKSPFMLLFYFISAIPRRRPESDQTPVAFVSGFPLTRHLPLSPTKCLPHSNELPTHLVDVVRSLCCSSNNPPEPPAQQHTSRRRKAAIHHFLSIPRWHLAAATHIFLPLLSVLPAAPRDDANAHPLRFRQLWGCQRSAEEKQGESQGKCSPITSPVGPLRALAMSLGLGGSNCTRTIHHQCTTRTTLGGGEGWHGRVAANGRCQRLTNVNLH